MCQEFIKLLEALPLPDPQDEEAKKEYRRAKSDYDMKVFLSSKIPGICSCGDGKLFVAFDLSMIYYLLAIVCYLLVIT